MNFVAAVLAFISEYLDSALGMGYGTALAPILILLGYPPLSVIPAILISQFVTDVAACFTHHCYGNVNLKINSKDFKTAFLLSVLSIGGVVLAVVVALKVPKWLLTLYIGCLVFGMGILILATAKKRMPYSWRKITGIGFLAAFNKGISGGGYGPLLMGGQILSGIKVNNAIGITAFAEAAACLAGFITYLVLGRTIDWKLTAWLVLSAVPAVPFAGLTVKKVDTERLKKYVGILITVLGLLTLLKISGGS